MNQFLGLFSVLGEYINFVFEKSFDLKLNLMSKMTLNSNF
jgi:hypothetical protein